MAKKLRIALTGGGSGGHVYPLQAVAEEVYLQAEQQGLETSFHYVGGRDPYVDELIAMGVSFHRILVGKWRRYLSIQNLIDIPKFFIGLLQAFFKMFWLMPDVVFSKGGTGALPVVWTAWFYRIPVVIHESDTVPGLSNLLSARFARRIGVSFRETSEYFHPQKGFFAGNPIRKELFSAQVNQQQAKEALGFSRDEPLLIFLGGSQGADIINEFVELSLKDLLPITQVLHQTGKSHFQEVERLSRAARLDIPAEVEAKHAYKDVGYLSSGQMAQALSAADVAIARAGSSTIFELAAFGTPAILVPHRFTGGDHQRKNAYAFAKAGAATVLEEDNFYKEIVVDELEALFSSPEKLEDMRQAAQAFATPNAAAVIAREVLNLATV